LFCSEFGVEHNGLSLDYDMEMLFLANESRGLDGLVTKHSSFANELL
jgi:hypothetical protein